MKATRREVLAAGASAAVLLAGCSKITERVIGRRVPDRVTLPEKPDTAVRILNRAGFGPAMGDAEMVASMGIPAYLDLQLHPDGTDDPALMLSLSRFEALASDATELEDLQEGPVMRQLSAATLLRATYSKWQLRERMVDVWSNHFNIFAQKAHGAYRKPTDDLAVVRKHALGSFPEMLAASAKSPAMLTYLDNQVNNKAHPNENYARELMELHTLGVHGGYSQKDVMEVARCFTGWGVENRFLRHKGAFRFDEDQHDKGEKTVLGHKISAGGGVEDGEQVLAILGAHPGTAHFVASKLCRHFLGTTDTPWVEKVAAIYLQSHGDIATMLRPLLLSDEVLHGPPVAKRPLDYLVSALRATGAKTDGDGIQSHLDRMGQPLFGWPMPDGYPDKAASWSGSMLARWNFAIDLTTGKIPGTHAPIEELIRNTDGGGERATAIAILNRRPRADEPLMKAFGRVSEAPLQMAALALSSPEFQYR